MTATPPRSRARRRRRCAASTGSRAARSGRTGRPRGSRGRSRRRARSYGHATAAALRRPGSNTDAETPAPASASASPAHAGHGASGNEVAGGGRTTRGAATNRGARTGAARGATSGAARGAATGPARATNRGPARGGRAIRGPRGARPSGTGLVGSTRNRSGLAYPNRVPSRRTPRWRPAWSDDGATVPIVAPRETVPARAAIVASGMWVTRHGPHTTVTMPLAPIRPANATRPPQAARTGVPGAAAKSTPRWRPASKGRPGSKSRVRSPATGAMRTRASASTCARLSAPRRHPA